MIWEVYNRRAFCVQKIRTELFWTENNLPSEWMLTNKLISSNLLSGPSKPEHVYVVFKEVFRILAFPRIWKVNKPIRFQRGLFHKVKFWNLLASYLIFKHLSPRLPLTCNSRCFRKTWTAKSFLDTICVIRCITVQIDLNIWEVKNVTNI